MSEIDETKEKKIRDRKNDNIGGGGKILAFFLGVVIGIGAIAGTVAVIVSTILNKPIKEITTMVDGKENGDIYQTLFGTKEELGYLNASYANKKVSELLGDTVDAVTALTNGGSLNDLNKISPKVDDVLSKALDTTNKYEIPLEKDALMSKPLDQLGGYAFESLTQTPLGGLLKAFNDGNETTEALWLAVAYGEENVDYTYDATGKIVMKGNAKKTTLDDLLSDGGVDKVFDKLTLEALNFSKDDEMMRALAYGPETHYVLGKDEKNQTTVTMKQIEFVMDGGKMYDIDGEEVQGTYEAPKLTVDEQVYYLEEREGKLYAYLDEEKQTPAKYPKTRVGDLTEDGKALFNGIYLKDALSVTAKSHPVMISLAYGVRGQDYEIVGEGENKTIEPLGHSKPRTLGYFNENSDQIINEISLADIFDDPDVSSTVTMYMLYGSKENIHYLVNVDGEGNKTFKSAGQKRIAIYSEKAYDPYKQELPGTVTLTGSDYTYTDTDGVTYKCVQVTNADEIPTVTIDSVSATPIPYYYLTDMEDQPVYYTATTIGDLADPATNPLSNFEKQLTLADILGEEALEGNNILEAISHSTISNMDETIENLTVSDVFGDSIMTDRTWWYLLHNGEKCYKDDYNNHGLYHADKGDTHNNATCQFEVDHAAYHASTSTSHYNGDGEANACVFTHQYCCGDDCDNIQDYKINDMEQLITNMSNNMKLVTLRTLNNDGMVALSPETLNTDLATALTVNLPDPYPDVNIPIEPTQGVEAGAKVGDLTISQTITYIGHVLEAINDLSTWKPNS